MSRRNPRPLRPLLAACLLALLAGTGAAEEADEGPFEGHVSFLLRDVEVDGSRSKHDEDFDGLRSGLRLGELLLEWRADEERAVDHVRLFAAGFGGDPDEELRFELSRRGVYELRLDHSSRRFVYELFELSDDEDGHSWDTRSDRTALGFEWTLRPRATLLAGIERAERKGRQVFMKDLSRDVFLLDAPADRRRDSYWIGAKLELGRVHLDLRQTLNESDRRFVNTTENDPGLDATNSTYLDDYEWVEVERSRAHLTRLRLRTPLGERFSLTAGYQGTLFEPERFDSRVRQDAAGTAFDGTALLIAGGLSSAELERDHELFDAELLFRARPELSLRLGWRALELSDSGLLVQDLSGTGTVTERAIALDLARDELSASVEYRPIRRLGLRVGYEVADRRLRREGQGGEREDDFESRNDASLLAGLSWRPADWLRIHADRERSDLDAAFSSLSPLERSRTRVRFTFTPRPGLDLGFTFSEHESENLAVASRSDAESFTARIGHRPTQRVSWSLSWSRSEQVRVADAVFDGAGFGGPTATFPGRTVFDVDQRHLSGQLRLSLPRDWSASMRFDLLDAGGSERSEGSDPNVPPAVPSELRIGQDWRDVAIDVERGLPSGFFVGAGLRHSEYDEVDDRLDYEARVVELRFGQRF